MSDARIDFETRSAVDLKKTGAHRYFEDPTTDALCMAWAIGDGPVELWLPGQRMPAELFDHIAARGTIRAYNANFERLCFKHVMAPRYGWLEPEIRQWKCTMAKSLAMAFPGKLEHVAVALGLEQRKDDVGHRIMLQVSKPRTKDPLTWWTDPEKLQRLYEYCRVDVEVERAVDARLSELTPNEQEFWWLDVEINDRGLFVDQALCEAATKVAAVATETLSGRMAETTNFSVTSCNSVQQIITYLRTLGVETDSIAKGELEEILVRPGLPDEARIVLETRREAAKASVSKIRALQSGRSMDGRAKGLLQYHAASTGRDGGRRFQPTNLIKPTNKDIDGVIEAVMTGDARYVEAMYGAPLTAVADCIRGMARAAPGNKLIVADYNAIEARVLAWLAGQHDLVHLFATGGKVYETMAAKVYGVPVERIGKPSKERDLGKTAVLGCGYGMGVLKFEATCYKAGITIDAATAQRAVDVYREANSEIKAFWYDLEDAAIEATWQPGVTTSAGAQANVRFKKVGPYLWCQLPSKRPICFPYPSVRETATPWGTTKPTLFFWGTNSYTRKWEEQHTYGGSLANNVTQGTARDILFHAVKDVLEPRGYAVVGRVYDEIICEVPADFGSAAEMETLMCQLPAWAKGCPVTAEGFEAERYRK